MGGNRIDSGPPPAECSGIRKRRTPPLVVPGNARLKAAGQPRGNAGPWVHGHQPPVTHLPGPAGAVQPTRAGALLDLAEAGIAQLQAAQRQAAAELTAMETV